MSDLYVSADAHSTWDYLGHRLCDFIGCRRRNTPTHPRRLSPCATGVCCPKHRQFAAELAHPRDYRKGFFAAPDQ